MEKESARNQTVEQHHERSKQVVRLHKKAIKIMKIVELTGLTCPTVRASIDRFEEGGWGLLSVINQTEGRIITFRDGRYSTTISSECGKAATFPSETYARFEANSGPDWQRKRVYKTSNFSP